MGLLVMVDIFAGSQSRRQYIGDVLGDDSGLCVFGCSAEGGRVYSHLSCTSRLHMRCNGDAVAGSVLQTLSGIHDMRGIH